MSLKEDIESIRKDIKLYTKLSGEDGSQETIATIGAYLRGYRQGKEDAEPHWIPVTERLPDNSRNVLITHKGGVSMAWYNGSYFEKGASTHHRKMQTVRAWCELPEPYKGATE